MNTESKLNLELHTTFQKKHPIDELFQVYGLNLAEKIERKEIALWTNLWPFPILHPKYIHRGMYDLYYHRFPQGDEHDFLVLDVGAGHQASPVSNIVGERYLEDTTHRPQNSKVINRKLVNLEATQLPFSDQQFDLCILSHVVEHLPPHALQQALEEGTRVAKECYVEVPHRDYENQWGFWEHYYFINQVEGRLVFDTKTVEEWIRALPQILEYTIERRKQTKSELIKHFHQMLVDNFDKYYLGIFLTRETLNNQIEIIQRSGSINSEKELARLKRKYVPINF